MNVVNHPKPEVSVTITDGINGPVICVDKWTLKMSESGPIQFNFQDHSRNWRLGCIEFDDKGACEFAAGSLSDETILVHNQCRRKGKFKYTIWAVPANGFGRPISLDPIIKNDPE